MEPASGGRRKSVLARQAADRIRAMVARLTPGDRLPSEAELARRFGRSGAVVRAALAELAAAGLVERVHGSGTFVGERAGRRTGRVGVMFYSTATGLIDAGYARAMFEGVLAGTEQAGQQVELILGKRRQPRAVTTALLDELPLERLDAIVAMEVFNDDLMAALAERMPVVAIDYACHRPGVSSCALDHRQVVDLAVEQLWSLGHRRIAFVCQSIAGSTDPAHRLRREGFEASMAKRNLPLSDESIVPIDHWRDTVGLLTNMARRPPARRPTALIHAAGSPWTAAQCLLLLGVQVPGQMSLIGIDRSPAWLDFIESAYRTQLGSDAGWLMTGQISDLLDARWAPLRSLVMAAVELPFVEMGRWAIEEATRRLADPQAEPAFAAFPGRIRPGNTVAPPP